MGSDSWHWPDGRCCNPREPVDTRERRADGIQQTQPQAHPDSLRLALGPAQEKGGAVSLGHGPCIFRSSLVFASLGSLLSIVFCRTEVGSRVPPRQLTFPKCC